MTRRASDHPWFKVIGWREAEALLGAKVNRRLKFYTQTDAGHANEWFTEYKVFTYTEWTHACSGCSCDCGDGYGCSHGAGGCEECGFSGKRRQGMHTPYIIKHEREFHGLAA